MRRDASTAGAEPGDSGCVEEQLVRGPFFVTLFDLPVPQPKLICGNYGEHRSYEIHSVRVPPSAD